MVQRQLRRFDWNMLGDGAEVALAVHLRDHLRSRARIVKFRSQVVHDALPCVQVTEISRFQRADD